jgi:hypothetical protein
VRLALSNSNAAAMKSGPYLGINLLVYFLSSCTDTDDLDFGMDPENLGTLAGNLDIINGILIPSPEATFEWRLDDLPDNFIASVDVIDIDAFAATLQ